jgi:hypothetical protein
MTRNVLAKGMEMTNWVASKGCHSYKGYFSKKYKEFQ